MIKTVAKFIKFKLNSYKPSQGNGPLLLGTAFKNHHSKAATSVPPNKREIKQIHKNVINKLHMNIKQSSPGKPLTTPMASYQTGSHIKNPIKLDQKKADAKKRK